MSPLQPGPARLALVFERPDWRTRSELVLSTYYCRVEQKLLINFKSAFENPRNSQSAPRPSNKYPLYGNDCNFLN